MVSSNPSDVVASFRIPATEVEIEDPKNPTKMELTDENIILVLEELLPYIEADGGWLEYVEQVDGYVKVRLGGACASCAMSTITLRDGIQKKLMMEIPEVKGVIQVL